MKTKFNINENILTVNFDFLYNLSDNQNKLKNIKKYVNNLIKDKKINFKGKKIIIYQNGLLIGAFYLVNYYFKKFNHNLISLNDKNNYFLESKIIEMNSNKIKTKKILTY